MGQLCEKRRFERLLGTFIHENRAMGSPRQRMKPGNLLLNILTGRYVFCYFNKNLKLVQYGFHSLLIVNCEEILVANTNKNACKAHICLSKDTKIFVFKFENRKNRKNRR